MSGSIGDIKGVAAPVELKPDVLVIGGGVAGVTAASLLSRAGINVTLVERNADFPFEEKGLCLAGEGTGIKELSESAAVSIISGAKITGLKGHFGGFEAEISTQAGEKRSVRSSAIVVAAGCAKGKEAERLPFAENIVALSEMGAMLSEKGEGRLMWKGKGVNSVTFLLDHANEDIKFHAEAALNQSLSIRKEFNCPVAVVCRDLKVSFDGGERLYLLAREAGVMFYKYEEKPAVSLVEGRICLSFPDHTMLKGEEREEIIIHGDLLVVPEVCAPDPELASLAGILRVPLGDAGYLMADNPQFQRIRSNRRGVFIAGACRFPQSPMETAREARAVADEIAALLKPGFYQAGPLTAEVDAAKCAVCCTCIRLCPHAAIDLERYAAGNVYRSTAGDQAELWTAARVQTAACQGCGLCVAECPARAISLKGEEALNAWVSDN